MVFALKTQGVALGCHVWALSGQRRDGAVPAISARRASHIAAQGNALGAGIIVSSFSGRWPWFSR